MSPLAPTFEVAGRGPDLILLHGWASSRRLWRHLLPQLTSAFRCWTIDLPGFGGAPDLGDRAMDPQAYSEWLEGFCLQQGLDTCGVVGHSLGGALTLQFAADQPQRVKAFAAINPVVTGRVILRALERLPQRNRWMAWSQGMSQSVLGPLLAGRTLDAVRERVWPIQRRIEDFNNASSPTLLHTWNLLTAFDIRPRLASVTAPGLIILGDRDINVPNSDGLSAVAALSQARLVYFKAGHTLTDTHPLAVARLLCDFFAPHLAAEAHTP